MIDSITEAIKHVYDLVINALVNLGVNFDLDVEGFLDKLLAFIMSFFE